MNIAIDLAERVATVDALLAEGSAILTAAGVGTPRLDAELLLAAACGVDRTALYVRGREQVSAACAQTFRDMLDRRRRREPLQYIVGRQEFWSLDFAVTPDVLVPRPETELLVELALGALRARGVGARSAVPLRLCDVGTGSGCIAVVLATELPGAEVWALDDSTAALAVADANARRHGVAERIRFVRSDLFSSVSSQLFDVVVSNPPYLTANDLANLQPEVAFEPRSALDGGGDGLDVIRRLLAASPEYLGGGGWLLVEIGATQAAAVEDAARAAGFTTVSIHADYAGLPRVLMARC
jgi:release factor glutamine methyltransferase